MTLVFNFLVLAGTVAHGWDSDVHLNVTYIIARDLGYSDTTAKLAASRAVWTDESWASGPFGSAKARVINHFNGIAQRGDFGGEVARGLGGHLKTRTARVSQSDSPVADALFMDALKKGDLESAFGHGHSIQDKEPHAEFYGEIGHVIEGHWPDRYWLVPEKFRASVLQTYRYLFAVRQLLPPEALDFSAADSFVKNGKPEDLDNPDLLAQRFLADPQVTKLLATDFLRDPRYVKLALASFLEGLKASDLVNKEVATAFLLPKGLNIDGSLDYYSLMTRIISQGAFMSDNNGNKLFTDKVTAIVFPEFATFQDAYNHYFQQALRELKNSNEEMANEIARTEIADRITRSLSIGNVPRHIDAKKIWVGTYENANLRRFELSLRTTAWNEISKTHNGHKVGYRSLSLVRTPLLSKILSNVPGLDSELFNNIYDATNHSDPEVEMVKLNFKGRMNWVRRQWEMVYTKSWDYLASSQLLSGAYDYLDQNKLHAMIAEGKIRKYTTSDLAKMVAQDPKVAEYAALTIKRWFESMSLFKLKRIPEATLRGLDQNGQIATNREKCTSDLDLD